MKRLSFTFLFILDFILTKSVLFAFMIIGTKSIKNINKITDMSIKIHPRPYVSTTPMRISVKSDHVRMKWVLQWKPKGYSKWFVEDFDSFCDFASRVSWFRFHNFKIRTFERYTILKSIDI